MTNRTRRTKAGIASREIPEPVLNFGSLHAELVSTGIAPALAGKGSRAAIAALA
jgi:hypothetical protein